MTLSPPNGEKVGTLPSVSNFSPTWRNKKTPTKDLDKPPPHTTHIWSGESLQAGAQPHPALTCTSHLS